MRKVKLWTGLLAIFVSGFAAGFFTAGVHSKSKFERIFSGGPPAAQEVIVNRLTRELDLSESQRAHVKTVVARTQTELLNLRQKHLPEVRALVDASIVEMKTQLDPEQCRKLDRHFEALRKKWWGWRGYPGRRAHHVTPDGPQQPPGPASPPDNRGMDRQADHGGAQGK